MKRLSLFTFIIALLALPTLAQSSNPDLITLNDATPAIDVVITLPADTTGTLSLDLALAAVTLTDANDAVVFTATDERLHGLEFNIAPNSGTHTLTVERLPDVTEAYVSVVSLPEMTIGGTVQTIEGDALALNQEATLSLNADNPGGTVSVDVPADMPGVITATFPGAFATTQLVDGEGVLIAESTGGHVDALTFVLDGGSYDFTLLGSDLTGTVIAGVRAVSAEDGGFAVIDAPLATAETITQTDTSNCNATVTASSANLRSGPGTGYSVLGYAYRGENYTVGGQNQENNWVVVGTDDGGSAWLALSAAQMQGACATLTVFDTPTQDAAPAQITITGAGANGEITREQAIQIAEAAHPGTRAVDIEQDYEYGGLVWEVGLSNGVDVYVDTTTGAIVYQENAYSEGSYDDDDDWDDNDDHDDDDDDDWDDDDHDDDDD